MPQLRLAFTLSTRLFFMPAKRKMGIAGKNVCRLSGLTRMYAHQLIVILYLYIPLSRHISVLTITVVIPTISE